MHQQAYEFVARIVRAYPGQCAGRVLELGAYDVNGSVRPLFASATTYTGLDVRPGPGVDVVADAATWDGKTEGWDVIVSTEMLEHAVAPLTIIDNAARMLAPGGLLIITAAGPERAPHSCDGRPEIPPGEHYANISPIGLTECFDIAGLVGVQIERNVEAGDVYAIAFKPEKPKRSRKK